MIFLLIMFFFLVVFSSKTRRSIEQRPGNKDNRDYVVEGKKDDFIVEDVEKFCPPHKWRYQEVRDTEGNTVRWRIICDLCGPLKPSDGPARMR